MCSHSQLSNFVSDNINASCLKNKTRVPEPVTLFLWNDFTPEPVTLFLWNDFTLGDWSESQQALIGSYSEGSS